MRFFRVKHEQNCKGCGSNMMPGEEAVVILVYEGIPLCFHVECFLSWSEEMFKHRLEKWRAETPPVRRKPKPRMGRPRKYVNPMLANKIRCSLYYHIRVGNSCKVQELKFRLDRLKA